MIMNDHSKTLNDVEIDLSELFLNLWHGKVYILLFSIFFVFLASMHLRNTDRLYLVEYKLKPVGQTQKQNNLSGLSGFASFAGVQLPSNSSNDYKIFKELISSVEVSELIFKNKTLINEIYANEWNSSLNNFSGPSLSKYKTYINDLKRNITGNKQMDYMPPNPRRLAIYISDNISINEDINTGFLTLKSETSKPELILSLIDMVINTTDQIMRQRYIDFSKEPLEFYKEKLRTARSREHREALAGLIGKEEQKLMFASRGKYFTVEPYIKPTISLYPVAPKPSLVLLLSLILGLITGCGMVLLRKVLIKR